MKPSLSILTLLCLCLTAQAQSVTIAWNPSPNATGYVLEWGTNNIATSEYSARASGLVPASTNIFTVYATNSLGQTSQPSLPVTYIVPRSEYVTFQAKTLAGQRTAIATNAQPINLLAFATHPGFWFQRERNGGQWIDRPQQGGTPENYAPPPDMLPPMPMIPVRKLPTK